VQLYLDREVQLLHSYDTCIWFAKTPDGWISAQDHCSADPDFAKATRIRIEPLYDTSIQAILDAVVPEGYTAFLRTDIHQAMDGTIDKVGYILALEKGKFEDRGYLDLSNLPIVDGFRAELQTWDGYIEFESSHNFVYKIYNEHGIDVYKFVNI
jgi:hypothetical protein